MTDTVQAVLRSSTAVSRHPSNPILSADDVPYHATLVFNAGVCKFQGRYVMVFRNDYGDAAAKRLDGVSLGLATSDDGVAWEVSPRPLYEDRGHPLWGAYDPRLTVLDGRLYMCFARGASSGNGYLGTCGGLAVTDDLERWEVLSVSVPDNRNMVLFPQRFDGRFVRLERPFAGYLRPGDRFDTWISASPDGRYWGDSRPLMTASQVPWVNNKIGPGSPPVRTPKGWLSIYHGVDIDPSRSGWGWSGDWKKRYAAGVMLQDLDDPFKLIGYSRQPVLAPEAPYETAGGYRDYTIFPGGFVLEDDGEARIYYGAADTVECLATADVGDLLDLCEPV